MGGRGTFAAGRQVEYTYKTTGFVEDVKVLEGISGKHGLPESSHSSSAYIKLNKDGSFREMRFYDEHHVLYLEIGYHVEPGLSKNGPVLHYHVYDERFSKFKDAPFYRSEARLLTAEMKEHYRKYFKGVPLN